MGATTLPARRVVGKLLQPLNPTATSRTSTTSSTRSRTRTTTRAPSTPALHRLHDRHRLPDRLRRRPPSPATTAGTSSGTRPTRATSGSSTTREAPISLAHVRRETDSTPATRRSSTRPRADLKELGVAKTNARFDPAYQKIPDGTFAHRTRRGRATWSPRSTTCPRAPTPACSATGTRAHHGRQRLRSSSSPVGAAGAGPRLHQLPARPGERTAELRVRRLPAGDRRPDPRS